MNESQLVEILSQFEPFDRFSEEDRVVLASRAEIVTTRDGTSLFKAGDSDPWLVCLYSGSVVLTAQDGRQHLIDAGTPAAKRPLGRLKPRQYGADAVTPVSYIRIDETGLGDVSNLPSPEQYEVHELTYDGEWHDDVEPVVELRAALENNTLRLPSLPVVALKVIRVIDDDEVAVSTVNKIVMSDPAIATKLIRAANSAVFYRRGEVHSCERAIKRLGLRSVRQLVVTFAMRELFDVATGPLQKRMQKLWAHSTHTAALAMILARKLRGFDPGEAQLAGLLHSIGVVPLLHYAAGHSQFAKDTELLDRLCVELAPWIGERMLLAWNFPVSIVTVARNMEQWWRDPGTDPELADLIIVAQYLTYIHSDRFGQLPPLIRLPAFTKTVAGKLDPEELMSLIEEASGEIAELRSLFDA